MAMYRTRLHRPLMSRVGYCAFVLLVMLGTLIAGCAEDPQHLLAQARIALNNGRPDIAFEEARKVLRQDRDNVDALLIRAEAQMQMEQFEPSMRTLERVLTHDADSVKAHELMCEWVIRRMNHLLREPIVPESTEEAAFQEAQSLGMRIADWLEAHERFADAAYLRAQVIELDARRLYALANDPRSLMRATRSENEEKIANDAPRQHSRSLELFDRPSDPRRLETINQADALIAEATEHLARAFEADVRHFDAAGMYVRLLVQQQEWDTVWKVATTLAVQPDLTATLVDYLLVALFTVPSQEHDIEAVKQLGATLRDSVADRDRGSATWQLVNARLMVLDEDWPRAQTLLTNALKQQPGHADTEYLLALCAFRQQQYEVAEKHLTRLANALPGSATVQSLYGRTLLAKGDYAAARKPLRLAVQLNGSDQDTRYAYMQTLVRLGQLSDAEPYIQDIYKHDPADAQVIMLKMQLERSRENRAAVAQLLEQTEKLSELNDAHLSVLIDGYRYLGRFDKVEAFARRLNQARPDAFEVRLALAEAMLAQGRNDEAAQMLQELSVVQPDHPAVRYLMGRFDLSRQAYGPAAEALQNVVAQQPRNPQARLLLAHALIGLNDAQGAVTQIEQAVQLAPENIAARDLAIRVYHLLGRHDEARRHLQQVQTRALNEEDWPVMLAMKRMQENRLDEASAICRRRLAMENPDPLLHLLLSSIEEGRGRIDEAQQQILAFLAKQAGSLQAHRIVAAFFIRHDRAAQGIELTQRVLNADAPLKNWTVAQLYMAQGEHDRAIALLSPDLHVLIEARHPLAVLMAQSIAQAYMRKGDSAGALATLDQLVAADTLTDEATLLQVDILAQVGDAATANAKLEALVNRVDGSKEGLALEVLRRLVQREQHDQALVLVNGWLERQPGNTALMSWRAELLLQTGQLAEAARAFEAITSRTRDVTPWRALAATQMQMRDYPAAEATYIRMAELGYEAQAEALVSLGNMYLAVGLNGLARETFDRLEQTMMPSDQAIALQLGQMWLTMNEHMRARGVLNRIARESTRYTDAQVLLAQCDLEEERVDNARQRITALMKDVAHIPAIVEAVLAVEDETHRQMLVEWCAPAVTVEALDETLRRPWALTLVTMYAERGDWNAALQVVRQLNATEPDPAVREVILLLHLALDQREQAEQLYDADDSLKQLPRAVVLGFLLDRKPATDAPPPSPLVKYVLAMARGHHDDARAALQNHIAHGIIFRSDLLQAIDSAGVSTSSRQAYRYVAMAMLAQDAAFVQLTQHLCRQAIALDPTVAIAHAMLAQFAEPDDDEVLPPSLRLYVAARRHQMEGQHAASVPLFEQLARREPDNPYVQHYLAQALERAGMNDAAIEHYMRLWRAGGSAAMNVGNDLAYLLAEYRPDQLEQAHRIATTVLQNAPGEDADKAYLLDTLGWIEHKRGNHTVALKLLQRAIPYLRDHPTVHEHLTTVYRHCRQNLWASYHDREAAQRR